MEFLISNQSRVSGSKIEGQCSGKYDWPNLSTKISINIITMQNIYQGALGTVTSIFINGDESIS